VDRIGRKQGALGRESALPLTGRRAEAVLVLRVLGGSQIPSTRAQGARQRASEAGSRPSLPADNAGKRERCSEGSRSRARRTEQAEVAGKPGAIVQSMLKLEARRQAKLHSIMLSPRFRPGGQHGSCHHRRKPMEAVIRGPNDPWSARVVSRLQTLGRRIFPGERSGPKGSRRGPGSA
jgi:hypothetical protein